MDTAQIKDFVDGYKHIVDFGENDEELEALIAIINKQAGEARTSDSGKLKHDGILYVPRNPQIDTLKPPIPKSTSKANRGFNHPVAARMLCPRYLLEDFDNDAETLKKILDGRIKIMPGDWATFLYSDNAI